MIFPRRAYHEFPPATGSGRRVAARDRTGHQPGFTLIEMIIAIDIFSLIAIAAVAITTEAAIAQAKTASTQAVQDNVRFGVELITKELRTGIAYGLSSYCNATPGKELSFMAADGKIRVYYLSGTNVKRLVGTTDCSLAATFIGDDVDVTRMQVRIGGQASGSADGQPWAMITLSVQSHDQRLAVQTRMDLATTVVARARDL